MSVYARFSGAAALFFPVGSSRRSWLRRCFPFPTSPLGSRRAYACKNA